MRKVGYLGTALSALALLALVPLHTAAAEVVCIQAVNKVVKGKVVTQLKKVKRATKCKTGEVREAVDMSVYGDGSAGAKTFGTETLSDMNAMYTNVTVTGTLTVPSGTVIRCTGTFVNNGTINVSFGARGAGVTHRAHPGISLGAAGDGGLGTTSDNLTGGAGGTGLSESAAALLRYPGATAGGGSGGFFGRKGGGALTILCKGGITNAGTITANGEGPLTAATPLDGVAATGGGGGGVVILASATAVTLASGSSLAAAGGDGREENSGLSTTTTAPGGGGGGGIVHLLAPVVSTTGATINVNGGTGGPADTLGGGIPPSTRRRAGDGGGASGGSGGTGASVTASVPAVLKASDGSNGHIITSVLDPTPLF